MKITRVIFFTAILSFLANGLFAQLVISGEVRPRAELNHGYKTLASPNQDYSFFTTQRTRLNAIYSGEILQSKIVLQDVRLWGSQAQLVSNEAMGVSVHEAWAELMLIKKVSLKAGRQEVIYDDHRIFGSVDWAQQARSHDLALLKYENDSMKFKAHLGFAYHQDADLKTSFYTGADAYKAMQYLWLHKIFGKLSVSILALNNGKPFAEESDSLGNMTKQGIRYSQTIGTRTAFKNEKLNAGLNFYYQMGDDGNGNDLSAFDLGVDIGYTVAKGFTAGLGYEFLSGTAYNETSGNKSFNPLYGTNHKFNGFMDYFYVGNHANSVGLQDITIKLKYTTGKEKKVFVGLDTHIFSAASDISATDDKYLGTEIDFVAGYIITPEADIKLGYSQLFASSSMETLKGGSAEEAQQWAWIMITAKPTLFKSKKDK